MSTFRDGGDMDRYVRCGSWTRGKFRGRYGDREGAGVGLSVNHWWSQRE